MRLSDATMGALAADVARPVYDRAALKTGIIHLGIGAFHRAHQAVYTEDCLAAGDPRWGIVGASLRSPETGAALVPQNGLYTLAVRSGAGKALRVIGAITDVLVGPDDPAALITAMSHPDVKIVSLTVTEKGYCHDPATGLLREDHPDIRHDLAHPTQPRSALGFILAALMRRRALGLPPFTVLTCDNLPANGKTVKRVLTRFATLISEEWGIFIHENVACPCTMVDRIVPATTDDDRASVAARLGVTDAWPVVTEPFSQWVIEDHFPQGRPDWAMAGAELVADVAPYEAMKLRMLNGAHSTLAYLGVLSGHQTVADAMADPQLARFVADMMLDEIIPTLTLPPLTDVEAYRLSLLKRFRNPALKHRTGQIAMDGSQKLPQRLLGTIRDRLDAGQPINRLALAVAGWMRYVAGFDDAGDRIDLRDPMAAELRDRADKAGCDAPALAASLTEIPAIFGSDLPRDPRFVTAVTAALTALFANGVEATLARQNSD